MKKIIVLLSIVMLFVTGCSISNFSDTDIGENIRIILSDDSKLYNTYYEGYKYYVPRGLKLLNKNGYNAIYLDRYNNRYYLYVDVISYYHKIDNKYMINNDIYYSSELNFKGKNGYINIEKMDDLFYIQYMYNYAKIEALVDERDLVRSINYMSSILKSVTFNDGVIESLIGNNVLSYQEEDFTLFDTEKAREDLLEVVQDDGSNKDKLTDDEDLILNND